MEKLKKYLEKIGINETQKGAIYTRPIECHKITYGDDYFYNAPNYFYNAYLIIFDYNTDADASYFKNLQEKENKIRAYAKKYNYEVFNSYIHPWARSFCIARRDDREKAKIFFSFRDETIEKVNQAIHTAAINHKNMNDAEIKKIMVNGGNLYNEFLENIKKGA